MNDPDTITDFADLESVIGDLRSLAAITIRLAELHNHDVYKHCREQGTEFPTMIVSASEVEHISFMAGNLNCKVKLLHERYFGLLGHKQTRRSA